MTQNARLNTNYSIIVSNGCEASKFCISLDIQIPGRGINLVLQQTGKQKLKNQKMCQLKKK